MEPLFNPETLAKLLGIAEQTIYNRHSTGGDLPPSVKLGRSLRFRPTDVMDWLDKKQPTRKIETTNYASAKRTRGRPTKKEEIESRRR
jgi:predicted DNA-binding transcriptional regulator AlpA